MLQVIPTQQKYLSYFLFALFIAISLYIAPYHEPWADEVLALLIAREASFYDLITIFIHTEGQPTLWHLLLKVLLFVFGDTLNITYVSITIMSIVVWLILFKYKLPFIYKAILPFGYFFIYQYNIISRNYCLAYLALALLGIVYEKRHIYIWCYAFCLLFLALTSGFYAPVAAILGIFWFIEGYQRTNGRPLRYLFPLLMLAVIGMWVWVHFLPLNIPFSEKNASVINNRHLILDDYFSFLLGSLLLTFFEAESFFIAFVFFIMPAAYRFFVNLPMVALRRNKKELFYYFSVLAACLLVYCLCIPMYYHGGMIWGIWLCSTYIFFPEYARKTKHYFFIFLAFLQIYWAGGALAYDRFFSLTSHIATAQFLEKHVAADETIYIAGYNTLNLQQTLDKNRIFQFDKAPLYVAIKNFRGDKFIQQNVPVLVLDIIDTPARPDSLGKTDISTYNYSKNFYKFIFPSGLFYHSDFILETSALVFIHKDFFIP